MKIARFLFGLLTLAVFAANAAIYQCDEGNKKVFQDRPCDSKSTPLDVRPANRTVARPAESDWKKAKQGIKERLEKTNKDREADNAEYQKFKLDCRQLEDEFETEAPYLTSGQRASRNSAGAKLSQLRRDYAEKGCKKFAVEKL